MFGNELAEDQQLIDQEQDGWQLVFHGREVLYSLLALKHHPGHVRDQFGNLLAAGGDCPEPGEA